MPPIVHSRHPLWDQDDLHTGDPRTVGLINGLSRWPLTWRAALITSTNHAEPEEVIRVSGPSIWPFLAACATVLFFIAEMIHRVWLLGLAAVAIIVTVVLWNRPEPVPTTDAEEQAFEQRHHISVRTDGGRSLAAWGMGLALLVVAIAFSTLLLAYFYLLTESPQWPPAGVDEPALTLAAVASIAVVAAASVVGRARRDIEAGETARLRIGLAVGSALIAAGGLIQVVDLGGVDFSPTDHAYGSIYYLLTVGMAALALAGLVILGVVLAAALRNEFTPRRHAAVINAHRYAVVLASLWVIGAATLHLAPYLT